MRRAGQRWSWAFGASVLAVGLLAAAPARADLDPTKPDEKAPDAAGHGDAPIPHQNPLPGIIDLMREVEEALADADTEGWTQREQERVVEALKGQQDTIKKLEKLIEEIEAQAQQQGGGGGQASGKASGSKRSGQPSGKRKSGNNSKSTDPQKSGQNGQEKKSRQQAKNDRRSRAKKRQDAAAAAAAAKRAKAGDGWGNLPMKAAREVLESTARKKPLPYREQLDRYFKRLTKGRR